MFLSPAGVGPSVPPVCLSVPESSRAWENSKALLIEESVFQGRQEYLRPQIHKSPSPSYI